MSLFASILAGLEELRKVQPAATEQELARARAQVKASLLMSLESTGSRCEQLARAALILYRAAARHGAVLTDDTPHI